jgi:ATP-dependent RNA helicase DeaD
MQRERSLVRIIEMENPTSAIIFCNTKATVHFVTIVLQRFGYDADELSSDLSQAAREKVMGRVKKRILRFLVATDVAARGIDIQDLSHVIQYEPPEDTELYIHRAGRTGRVGATGTAISIVAGMEQFKLKSIAKTYQINMEERILPSEEDVEAVVSQRITAALEADLRGRDRVQVERMQRFVALGRSLAEAEGEIPVIAMLLDDYYQRTLQTPIPSPSDEETVEPVPAAKRETSPRRDSDRPKRRGPSRDRDKDRPRRRRSGPGGGGESA